MATLAQIGELLPRRQGLIELVVTITGPAITKPGNYLTALGTPLRWALEQACCTEEAAAVVLGGPMMGPAIGSFDVALTKGVTGLMALTRRGVQGAALAALAALALAGVPSGVTVGGAALAQADKKSLLLSLRAGLAGFVNTSASKQLWH